MLCKHTLLISSKNKLLLLFTLKLDESVKVVKYRFYTPLAKFYDDNVSINFALTIF
jgi:hypothetical protein